MTKKQPKSIKNDKTKHRFVVGWAGDHQCIYGKSRKDGLNFVDPLTFYSLKKELEHFKGDGNVVVVYELVPFARFKSRRWDLPRPMKSQ